MRRTPTIAGWAATVLLAACAGSPQFSGDGLVRIVQPSELEVVTAPVTLTWRGTPTDGVRYAVFVDRTPIRPGQNLRSLANESCKRTPGCPDEAYLRERGIILTTQQQAVIPYIAKQSGVGGHAALPAHRATIVLIDADGRRVGEQAYTVEFRVAGEDG